MIAGLGPGADDYLSKQVNEALANATDIVGYITYTSRVSDRKGLTVHSSDNRCEVQRAELALNLALSGRKVVVVSSGDPGVFAMAAAIFEVLETDPKRWRDVNIEVLPGITAMLAAAARSGAPLGHDFCVLNLSNNLKPWALIEKRLKLAIEADFAMVFYNPSSRSRPLGFERTLKILKNGCSSDRPIIFARAVSTAKETINIVPLAKAKPDMADMQTIVLVGSSQTKVFFHQNRMVAYTPRSVRD